MDIAALVQACLNHFNTACDARKDANELRDELGRFKVWAGNMAAHRPGKSRRSLEYRLRNSSRLRMEVIALLADLQRALSSASDGRERRYTIASGFSSSQDGYEDESFELSDEDDVAPIDEALEEVHEVINCLYRFSMTLKNVARHDQLKEGMSSVTSVFEPYDIQHVQAKFPDAPEYLVKRLGKTISRHRQYFRYREAHSKRLHYGIEGETHDDAKSSTVATSVDDVTHITRRVTRLDLADAESIGTATSFASSAAGDTFLKAPIRPETAQPEDPFECPICFTIIVAETEHAWRKHVFEDLPPYVCTYEGCPTGDQPFGSRSDWNRHERKMHGSVWRCPFACGNTTLSRDNFTRHIREAHLESMSSVALQNLAEQEAVELISKPTICIMCKEDTRDARQLVKHVGHHFLQLALFALPQHLVTMEEEDTEKLSDINKQSIGDVQARQDQMSAMSQDATAASADSSSEGWSSGADVSRDQIKTDARVSRRKPRRFRDPSKPSPAEQFLKLWEEDRDAVRDKEDENHDERDDLYDDVPPPNTVPLNDQPQLSDGLVEAIMAPPFFAQRERPNVRRDFSREWSSAERRRSRSRSSSRSRSRSRESRTGRFNAGLAQMVGIAASSNEKGQTRQPQSCTQCRERKMKCDRAQPCSACSRRGGPQDCSYATGEQNYAVIQQAYEIRRLRQENQRLKERLGPAEYNRSGVNDGSTRVVDKGADHTAVQQSYELRKLRQENQDLKHQVDQAKLGVWD